MTSTTTEFSDRFRQIRTLKRELRERNEAAAELADELPRVRAILLKYADDIEGEKQKAMQSIDACTIPGGSRDELAGFVLGQYDRFSGLMKGVVRHVDATVSDSTYLCRMNGLLLSELADTLEEFRRYVNLTNDSRDGRSAES